MAAALALLGVAHQTARRQARWTVLHAEAAADAPAAEAEVAELIRAVRQARARVQTLTEQGRAADAEIEAALRDADRPPADGPAPAGNRGCPAGCTEHGNCNELTGQCTCGLTRTGVACQEPTMPACSLEAADGGPPGALAGWVRGGAAARRAFGSNGKGGGKHGGGKGGRKQGGGKGGGEGQGGVGSVGGLDDVINLSYLAAESFWGGLRDMRVKDEPRRQNPRYRWVGMVTCVCVEQVREGCLGVGASPVPLPIPSMCNFTVSLARCEGKRTRKSPWHAPCLLANLKYIRLTPSSLRPPP